MIKDLLILLKIEGTGDEVLVFIFRDPGKTFSPAGGQNKFIRGCSPFPDHGFIPDIDHGDAEADGFCRSDQFPGNVSRAAEDQMCGRKGRFDIDGFAARLYPVALDHGLGLEKRLPG